jgi:predicted membrane channel-forming protein YqfA (hemolysin III family)
MRQKDQKDAMISLADNNEYVNALTHFLAAIVFVSATAVLAARDGRWAHLVGFGVYGTTLLLSFLTSCILHFFLLFGRYKRHCQLRDDSTG